jgi:hypothetical protein
VAGDHDLLPRREVGVELAAGVGQFGFEAGDVLGGVDAVFAGDAAQFVDPVLEIEERFFKGEGIGGHGIPLFGDGDERALGQDGVELFDVGLSRRTQPALVLPMESGSQVPWRP